MTLGELLQRFLTETSVIASVLDSPLPSSRREALRCEMTHDYGIEMCAIRLHDSWARFCRTLVIESAGGGTRSASGTPIPKVPGVRNKRDALARIRALNKKGWEPRWPDPTICLRVANSIGISNYAQVSLGLTVTPSPIDDLRVMRNHVAHRAVSGPEVRKIGQRHGAQPPYRPTDVLRCLVTPGIPLLLEWVEGIRQMARTAVN